MDNPKRYSTQNLYEAAYLLCRGFDLAGKNRDGFKMSIIFSGESVREEALKFYNGGKVEAIALTDAYRTLKDFVFER